MSTFNKAILMGNLTGDPQVRSTKSGKPVASFSLALNRSTGSGEQRREETTFIDVVVWDRLAELAERYLSKGRPVLIEGRLQEDSWQDKQSGQTRKKVRVVGERLEFVRDGQNRAADQPFEPEPALHD